MAVISVQNAVKAFEADKNILNGLTFEINEGERVGLLGKNGAGKTTLFRAIVGECELDSGRIVIPPGKKIGLISQIPAYPADFTAEDVLMQAQSGAFMVRARMEELEREMELGAGGAPLSEYGRLAAEYERLDGYTLDFRRNQVAGGLKIPARQREQLFDTLSGGEKTRVNLARLILEDTDILLLDEPTNHLDMRAVEWLEEYLTRFRGTVLTISHDRYFLDRAVTRTIELVSGRAELYGGGYSYYIVEKQRRHEEQLKRYEREQAEAKRLQATADRLMQWGTLDKGSDALVKKARAIETRIERITKTDRPISERKIKARFGEREFKADEALVLKGLSKSFDGRTLFSDVTAKVSGGERIALLGDNGAGKSTLLSIIMGALRPDSGYARMGPSVRYAFLPQLVKFDHPYRSALDTVIAELDCSPQTARNRLGAFKFPGEDAFKTVSDMSGGEKSRLRLCILMETDVSLLILDEPTNHLDLPSREWIEEALREYEGGLLFVSHDRYFTDEFATRVWELENGCFTDYDCTYAQYRARKLSAHKPAPQLNRDSQKHEKNSGKRLGILKSSPNGWSAISRSLRRKLPVSHSTERRMRQIL
ncbi:MAG: ATP-binding cassette domain-containing protein [Oscillospiraceae bacterium]|jgi:ATPase subunit of ABC transporter with duplicated ATPase domains|nr:ATP-binding cassette domain-containing protein [Oscillospiraceae bacterium]